MIRYEPKGLASREDRRDPGAPEAHRAAIGDLRLRTTQRREACRYAGAPKPHRAAIGDLGFWRLQSQHSAFGQLFHLSLLQRPGRIALVSGRRWQGRWE